MKNNFDFQYKYLLYACSTSYEWESNLKTGFRQKLSVVLSFHFFHLYRCNKSYIAYIHGCSRYSQMIGIFMWKNKRIRITYLCDSMLTTTHRNRTILFPTQKVYFFSLGKKYCTYMRFCEAASTAIKVGFYVSYVWRHFLTNAEIFI